MTASALWLLPFALQGVAMAVDELVWHRRRPVSRWEWLGHLLDTLVFLGCLAMPLLFPPEPARIRLFIGLAAGSCLLVTKDEFVHQRRCPAGEQWLHAVLFILHPLVLVAAGLLWAGTRPGTLGAVPVPPPDLARAMLLLQGLAVAGFLGLQAALGAGRRQRGPVPEVDNSVYDQLGERWYTAQDDPVGLLRAETRLRASWLLEAVRAGFGGRPLAILDVACGGGLLANPLAQAGHAVTGVDLSRSSLEVARRHDGTGTVRYLVQDARALDLADGQFDVVCLMDFLEHVEDRDAVLREAARVLKPGGWLFFHTFNRTPISWLIAIQGVRWAVPNTPRNLHVYRLFLKPEELREQCARHGLAVEEIHGVRPRVCTWAFLRLLAKARVGDDFQFRFTRSRRVGYCGRAVKSVPGQVADPRSGSGQGPGIQSKAQSVNHLQEGREPGVPIW
jgi:2-polyprenyl-6-hydroxyphenyl methylase/3-demethylubiquinone-9 3-methyltransferase